MFRLIGVVSRVLLASAAVYALLWGASWLVGEDSSVVFGRVDGNTFAFRPDVLFGGLPPALDDGGAPIALVAVAIGILGLMLSVVPLRFPLRRKRRLESEG